ncbi:MAG TPA: NAD(P)/FAD-dependent oxidoreductase [Anaerolineales bacterium]|nr:NAD(P)/FAD-dependent oxidoreductase [Anaerolineales bacterium]
MLDAIVVGSGPNGLAAAIRLAQAGMSVRVFERMETPGGGTRSDELTLPGYLHDICAAIHPLSLASPFLRDLPLADFGLEWVHSEVPFGHAFSPDEALLVHRDLDRTADSLGRDGRAYRRMMRRYVENWPGLMDDFLGPLPLPPKHPVLMTRFGLTALQPATMLAKRTYRDERTRAIFAGAAAHSMLPLEWLTASGFGLMLGVLAHGVGWPMAKGGSREIPRALVALLESLGGSVETGREIRSLDELPPARIVLLDLTPKGVLRIAGDRLNARYARELDRYRYGVGVCKVDWALSEPIPWKDPDLARTATVHIGGTLEQIAESEREIWEGRFSEHPFIILVQPTLFDSGRAPESRHTAWAYCHTPHGSPEDVTGLIEAEIEHYAPGFKDVILARSSRTAVEMEAYNPNFVGGDINGGVQNLRQFFTRPAIRLNPYRIPGSFDGRKLYICSSATPPGGGVHGMCGFYAAETVLRDSKK